MNLLVMDLFDEYNHLYKSLDVNLFSTERIYLALFSFLLLGIVARFLKGNPISLYKSLSYSEPQSANVKEKEIVQDQFAHFLFTALFLVNSGILLHYVLYQPSWSLISNPSLLSVLLCIAGMGLFYYYNQLFFLIVGYFFLNLHQRVCHQHYITGLSRITAVLLSLPALICLLAPQTLSYFVYGMAALILVFVASLLLIHLINNFLVKPISIFYLFLYLCTLEIVPLYWAVQFLRPGLS